MYKLILVDDEEEVRKGILKKIDWNKHGFEIVGEAENGREALDITDKVVPDVVITDIKMPFMDGIKLSEELREKSPTTKIIILTGFDEFEYAHKAIKLNVTEYVLKPISSKELVDVLIKTKEKLDKEIEDKRNVEVLKEHYRKSLPILKENFLSSLVTSSLSKEDIEEKSHNYDINLDGNFFAVAAVNVDSFSNDMDYEEKVLITFSIMNIVNEIIENHKLGTAFFVNGAVVILGVFKEDDKSSVITSTMNVLNEIHQSINKYLKLEATIGLGTFCSNITHISSSYENALSAIGYRMILGSNRVIWIEDIEPEGDTTIVFDELKERALSNALKVGSEEEISTTIGNLFDDIIKTKASLKDYQIYLMEVITTILKVSKNAQINITDLFGESYNLFVDLYKFSNLTDVKEWIKEICITIMKSINQGRLDNCKLIVDNAKAYIEEHYKENDLGINTVCSYLHISPTYFSSLFKKETKMTFVNYLTMIRMNSAKELLKTTNLKSFEVAEKVGYSEPNYFSYSFKKYFGISPSEFRNTR